MEKYILGPNNENIKTTFEGWIQWEKDNPDRKIISRNRIFVNEEEILISTVFLGLDHAFGHYGPILFETMIFKGEHDGWQDRYETYREAIEGHNKVFQQIINNEEF